MAKSILPIVALGAAALFLMKKKGSSTGGSDTTVPSNVILTPITGGYATGARVELGVDISDDQANQAVEIVIKYAKERPGIPFQVVKITDTPGLPVIVTADGVPHEMVAENISSLDATLRDLLNEHIPKTNA